MFKSTIAAGGLSSATRLATALLGLLVISGCGFHLQGRSVLPDNLEQMAVLYDNDYTVGDPEVVRVLKQRLRQRDQLGRATAPAVLRIVRVAQNQRTIAVSPVDGDAAVYQLSVQVTYNYTVNGEARLAGERVVAVRDYSVEASQRLSIDDQRRHTLEQMQNDLADQILARISQANQAIDASSTAETPE